MQSMKRGSSSLMYAQSSRAAGAFCFQAMARALAPVRMRSRAWWSVSLGFRPTCTPRAIVAALRPSAARLVMRSRSKINDLARSGKQKPLTVFQGILWLSFPPKRYPRKASHCCHRQRPRSVYLSSRRIDLSRSSCHRNRLGQACFRLSGTLPPLSASFVMT
jgi:hypothetical protein